VLLAGGGSSPRGREAVDQVEIIDLSTANPRWRPAPAMHHPRYHAYATLLPDRKVLVVGGRKGRQVHHPPAGGPALQEMVEMVAGLLAEEPDPPQDPLAVRETELFDPDAEQWSPAAPMHVDRLYHSNALLLPDGRVLVAGSNPDSKVNELRMELYRPPYLCKGPRPEIEAAPAQAAGGEEIEIRTPAAREVGEITLIRPVSTTHCFSTDQRSVGLAITRRAAGAVYARIPANPNLVPPGYYMLFILCDGVPSKASFLRLEN
jgi:hypothetical protein